jgi:FkbM family methyltransferase
MAVFPADDTDSGTWRAPSGFAKYAALIRSVRNWPAYLTRRWGGRKEVVLITRAGNLHCVVPRPLASAFREVVVYDTYEIAAMAAELGTEPVVVDLGANAGYFSLWLLAHLPGARVYAYEPLPGNLAILERNLAQNPKAAAHIQFFAKAVTGTPTESVEFHVQAANDLSMSASIVRESITKSARTIRVGATTLSGIMDENHLAKIDLLKIDCEGAEYEILFNTPAERFTRIQRIALETHVRPELNWDHAAAVKFLRQQGYAVRELIQHAGRSHLIWAKRR